MLAESFDESAQRVDKRMESLIDLCLCLHVYDLCKHLECNGNVNIYLGAVDKRVQSVDNQSVQCYEPLAFDSVDKATDR